MSLTTNTVLITTVTGRSGNGAITLTGAKVGDLVYVTPNSTNSFTAGNSQLETVISVNDQIQQTMNDNLTSWTWTVFLFRPATTVCSIAAN